MLCLFGYEALKRTCGCQIFNPLVLLETGSLGVFHRKPRVHLDNYIAMGTWYGKHIGGYLPREIKGVVDK